MFHKVFTVIMCPHVKLHNYVTMNEYLEIINFMSSVNPQYQIDRLLTVKSTISTIHPGDDQSRFRFRSRF